MYGILIITHGNFGTEMLKSLEMIMGQQENIDTLGLCLGDSVESLSAKANEIVQKNKEKGLQTFVLVDMLGGSPSNVAMSLLRDADLKILTGVNLPMVIAAIEARDENNEDYCDTVFESAVEGIIKKDRKILLG